MDFSLSDEQQMVIKEAKRFAEKKLAPKVEELDEKGKVILGDKDLSERGLSLFYDVPTPAS